MDIEKILRDNIYKPSKDPLCFFNNKGALGIGNKSEIPDNLDILMIISPDGDYKSQEFIKETLDFNESPEDLRNDLLNYVTPDKVFFIVNNIIERDFLSKRYVNRLTKFFEKRILSPHSSAFIEEIDTLPIFLDTIYKLEDSYKNSSELWRVFLK